MLENQDHVLRQHVKEKGGIGEMDLDMTVCLRKYMRGSCLGPKADLPRFSNFKKKKFPHFYSRFISFDLRSRALGFLGYVTNNICMYVCMYDY